jgi:hypothetical protein
MPEPDDDETDSTGVTSLVIKSVVMDPEEKYGPALVPLDCVLRR